jgi:S1-C subfamily serine protease
MPDQDQTGFSRVCRSCGRRVPRNVTTCRCGSRLPAESSTTAAVVLEESRNRSPAVIALIVGALAIGGIGYWLFLRPAPSATQTLQPAGDDEAAEAVDAPRQPATSPEARAWDAAAASSKDASPPPSPEADATPAAPTRAPLSTSASTEEMVDRVMPAVVLIEATSGRGSGFFVRHDTLVTNVHVVQNDGYVTLRKSDGSTVNARVDTRAPAFDIAILKVATPSPSQVVIPIGSAKSLRPGQEIVIIGSALGTLQNSVSRGIVSGLRTSGGATLVQTDAAANPGNSGGPMLDRNGSAIGITTLGYKDAEGLNFGVAIDHARDLLEGRQTNFGTARGLNDIQSQSRGSESDRQQQQGDEQLRARIGQLAQAAANIDAGWKRYRDQCFKSPIPGNYDRPWFALLVPRAMPNDAGAGCPSYYADMTSSVTQFRTLMQRAIADARRANVLPGTARDLLRSNRLEFDWDK